MLDSVRWLHRSLKARLRESQKSWTAPWTAPVRAASLVLQVEPSHWHPQLSEPHSSSILGVRASEGIANVPDFFAGAFLVAEKPFFLKDPKYRTTGALTVPLHLTSHQHHDCYDLHFTQMTSRPQAKCLPKTMKLIRSRGKTHRALGDSV